eukprot:g18186.t1
MMEGVINSAIKQHLFSNNLLSYSQLLTSLQPWFKCEQKSCIPELRGQILRRLKSYLTHRRMVGVVGGQSSQLQDMSAGVPQSSDLGPTIFIDEAADLPFFMRLEVGMFSDDWAMLSTIRDSSDTEAIHAQMQQDLDNIQAWAD